MSLLVIGAGVGRTGTYSLKIALEQLLGGACYHMTELFENPAHVPAWHAAAEGKVVDWNWVFSDYLSAVDWPAASFWPELCEAFPEAPVVLSLREPEDWWRSVRATIFHPDNYVDRDPAWHAMWVRMVEQRFTADLMNRDACIAAFNRHNEAVRRSVAPGRLIEWCVGDGWEPLCRALGIPIPSEDFPHRNSRREFVDSLFQRRPGYE